MVLLVFIIMGFALRVSVPARNVDFEVQLIISPEAREYFGRYINKRVWAKSFNQSPGREVRL